MIQIFFMFIFITTIRAYNIDFSKPFKSRLQLKTHYILKVSDFSYSFAEDTWGPLVVFYCDDFSYCDPVFDFTYCFLRPNCLKLFNEITNGFSQFFNQPNEYIYPPRQKYIYRDHPDNECKEQSYEENNQDKYKSNNTYQLIYSNVYNHFVYQIEMYDSSYAAWGYSIFYLHAYIFRHIKFKLLNHQYKVIYKSWKKYKLFTRFYSTINISFVFDCIKGDFGPHCLFKCVPNIRRTCLKRMEYYNGRYFFEKCHPGWVFLLYDITFWVDSCQRYKKEDIEISHLKFCTFRDECSVEHDCGFDQYCVITGNTTSMCVEPKYKPTSDQFKYGLYDEPFMVLPNTLVSIVLMNLPPPVDKLSSIDTFYNSNSSTYHCKSFECRASKNQPLTLTANRIIFGKGFYYGYDYLVNFFVFIDNKYHKIQETYNFTVINPPTQISMSAMFYLELFTEYYIAFVGFPQDIIYLTVLLNNETIGILKNGMPLKSMLWIIGFQKLALRCWMKFSIDNHTFIQKDSYVAVKAFKNFKWSDGAKFIYNKDDVLICELESSLSYDVHIRILYGDSYYNYVSGVKLHLKNLIAGSYKIVCDVFFPTIGKGFIRIKLFDLYTDPKMLCFLPFGMLRGILIKCTSDIYPPNLGNYSMRFTNLISGKIIEESNFNELRVPYVLEHKAVFSIACFYSYTNKKKGISYNLNVTRNLELWESTFIYQQFTLEDCHKYARLPQEYIYTSGKDGEMTFYPQNFYVSKNTLFVDFFFIFTIFIIVAMQYLACAISVVARFQTPSESFSVLLRHNQFLINRFLIRKVNDRHIKHVNDMCIVATNYTDIAAKVIPAELRLTKMESGLEFL